MLAVSIVFGCVIFWLKSLAPSRLVGRFMSSGSREPDSEPASPKPTGAKARAKAVFATPPVKAPPSASAAQVAAAAKALAKETGGPPVKATPRGPTPLVSGPLPPPSSSTGRRYYAFAPTADRAGFVAAGQAVCLAELGGSWIGHRLGRSPPGFSDLESAINWVITQHGQTTVPVRT
jgi:hypothetical protein